LSLKPLREVDAVPDALAAPAALHGDAIAAAVGGGVDVEVVRVTGSTNTDLLARARVRAPARPQLLAALEQTAGRGRRGRAWHAPPGAALLFSLARAHEGRRAADSAATLACGLAAAEALAEAAPVQLKWPNDLLAGGRKAGGVLCEVALDPAGARTLVVGIGINLWLDAAARAAIGQPAAALAEFVAIDALIPARERLIGRIARAVLDALAQFDAHGFAPLRARYLARFALLGREVELLEQGEAVAAGVAVDIDDAGRLLLETAAGTRAFASGEVSLRAAGTISR
jgi:BirA family biotin operon repressor/biotin-[acetyl-CoA-carboxylase] ligase